MSPYTHLDATIQEALARLYPLRPKQPFDIERYRQAFAPSAREKAKAVLDSLSREKLLFPGQRPVFVSIGGADGEEVDFLLRNSEAPVAVLVETVHELADFARARPLPGGKRIEIFEGDALQQIGPAMEFANSVVRSGGADFKVTTCHAVIHELYDRSEQPFDSLAFFAAIFDDERIPTWFTYREPAVPVAWPDTVLISADCSPQSLLQLAEAIVIRHPSLAAIGPKPLIVAGQLRVHSQLAMEILAKLFYLEDLQHEIEERSTVIHHQEMINSLYLVIGDPAVSERRAVVSTARAPSESFAAHWQRLGVRARALRDDKSTEPLSIPESHIRLISWRIPPAAVELPKIDSPAQAADIEAPDDLVLAERAFDNGDNALVGGLAGLGWEGLDRREEPWAGLGFASLGEGASFASV